MGPMSVNMKRWIVLVLCILLAGFTWVSLIRLILRISWPTFQGNTANPSYSFFNFSNKVDNYFAICMIVKSDIHLPEWIEYHHRLGCNKFYIFDHNSSFPLRPLIAKYINHGIVDLQRIDENHPSFKTYDGGTMQVKIYNKCINEYRTRHQWIGFIDSDEFLVVPQGNMTGVSPYLGEEPMKPMIQIEKPPEKKVEKVEKKSPPKAVKAKPTTKPAPKLTTKPAAKKDSQVMKDTTPISSSLEEKFKQILNSPDTDNFYDATVSQENNIRRRSLRSKAVTHSTHHNSNSHRQLDTEGSLVSTNESESPTLVTIPMVLRRYEDYGGLALNWMMIGTSGHDRKPKGGVLENYWKCVKNVHIKTIVNTKYVVKNGGTPHNFVAQKFRPIVDTNYATVPLTYNPADGVSVPDDSLYKVMFVNHYHLKSLEDFEEKMARGRFNQGKFSMGYFIAQNDLASHNCSILEMPPATLDIHN